MSFFDRIMSLVGLFYVCYWLGKFIGFMILKFAGIV
jgi:hypothetical protein